MAVCKEGEGSEYVDLPHIRYATDMVWTSSTASTYHLRRDPPLFDTSRMYIHSWLKLHIASAFSISTSHRTILSTSSFIDTTYPITRSNQAFNTPTHITTVSTPASCSSLSSANIMLGSTSFTSHYSTPAQVMSILVSHPHMHPTKLLIPINRHSKSRHHDDVSIQPMLAIAMDLSQLPEEPCVAPL
jgi:hypothetical protein